MSTETATIRDLRRLWKPHKLRLNGKQADHPTAVRFHRACSWLAEVEEMDPDDQSDLVLIQQWVAFNALYGQWDEVAHEPAPDRSRWMAFLKEIKDLDEEQRLAQMLVAERELVLEILGNSYLNRSYWRAECPEQQQKFARAKFEAQSWYFERRFLVILEQVLERVYLLRCQIVHGAATCGSQLNRDALAICTRILRLFMPIVLQIWIDHGSDRDWGALCYPPLSAPERPVRPR